MKTTSKRITFCLANRSDYNHKSLPFVEQGPKQSVEAFKLSAVSFATRRKWIVVSREDVGKSSEVWFYRPQPELESHPHSDSLAHEIEQILGCPKATARISRIVREGLKLATVFVFEGPRPLNMPEMVWNSHGQNDADYGAYVTLWLYHKKHVPGPEEDRWSIGNIDYWPVFGIPDGSCS